MLMITHKARLLDVDEVGRVLRLSESSVRRRISVPEDGDEDDEKFSAPGTLSDARRAHELLESSAAKGKLVHAGSRETNVIREVPACLRAHLSMPCLQAAPNVAWGR